MQNRSILNLPVLYDKTSDCWNQERGFHCEPSTLDLYEVNYLHYHNRMELGYCLRGSGVCHVEQQQFPFKAGDIQIVYPFQRHLSKSTGDSPSIWYWFNLSFPEMLSACGYTHIEQIENWLSNDMGLYGILDREQHPLIAQLIYELIFPPEEREMERVWLTSHLLRLIMELRTAAVSLPKLEIPVLRHPPWVSEAMEQIERELDQRQLPSVEDLAKRYFISPAGFRRHFTKAAGLSPQAYINVCRMKKVRRLLLETDLKILDISELAGFEDLSSFNRGFKKAHGMPPSEFRKGKGAGARQ